MSFLIGLIDGQGQGQQAGGASLIAMAGQLIEKAGGVQGLVSLLQQQGMGGAVQFRVGTGSNEPVSGDQLGHALQGGGLGSLVQQMAGKFGVDPSQLLGQLSNVLPGAVDHLTPGGQVPVQGQAGGVDLGMLEGLAGTLFG